MEGIVEEHLLMKRGHIWYVRLQRDGNDYWKSTKTAETSSALTFQRRRGSLLILKPLSCHCPPRLAWGPKLLDPFLLLNM
jgi:hypothetical protein